MYQSIISGLALLFTSSAAFSQNAVQWRVEDGGNGHWYALVQPEGGLLWENAREAAVEAGGYLVAINTQTENDFIQQLAGNEFGLPADDPSYVTHIGLFRETADSVWQWVDGSGPATFLDWACGEPNLGTEIHGVYMNKDCKDIGWKWADTPLMDINDAYIIEWDEAPAIQWRVEDGGNGHWYQVVDIDGGFSHEEAQAEAAQRGGYLVSLTSESEDTWVYGNLPAYDRWIGGVQDVNAPDYAEPAGGWGWSSGEAMEYTNWSGNGPDNNKNPDPEEEFTHYCCDGKWNDIYAVDLSGTVSRKQMIVEYTVLPGTSFGACCIEGLCLSTTESDCLANAGTWGGANSSCTALACDAPCLADLNGDGVVNGVDLAFVLGYWGIGCD